MVLCGISTPFGVLFPCLGKVAHALLTRPPLKQSVASYQSSPLDLHVLGTPPAFVLSQDQTLSFNPLLSIEFPQPSFTHSELLSCLRCFCSVSFSRFVPVSQAAFQRLAQPALSVYYFFARPSRGFLKVFAVFCVLLEFPNDKHNFQCSSFGNLRTFQVISFWFIRSTHAGQESLSRPARPHQSTA